MLLECSGHPGATADAIRAVAPAGTVVLVGMGGDEMTLPVSRIQERELTVTGTFRYAHTWPAAIALAASGRVQLDRLVTGHYGLDQVARGAHRRPHRRARRQARRPAGLMSTVRGRPVEPVPRALADVRRARVLGICGAPGAGKSTLAADLVAAVGPSAVVVPMDGFHLHDDELARLGLGDRKGAPETFDVAGYVALLRRLRTETDHVVYAPEFDRSREESVAGAIAVRPEHRLVVTEGNYLLLRRPRLGATCGRCSTRRGSSRATRRTRLDAAGRAGTSSTASRPTWPSAGRPSPTRPTPTSCARTRAAADVLVTHRLTQRRRPAESPEVNHAAADTRSTSPTSATGWPCPTYDRSQVTTGIVHFGVGGFHRAHQAMYLDALMNARPGARLGHHRRRRAARRPADARRAARPGLPLHAGGQGPRRHHATRG